MRRVVQVVAMTVALACAACTSSTPAVVKLDGSPRLPDAEGVVQRASINGVTLDGGRTYAVSPHLIAFSTYDRAPIQLATTVGDYVQVGVHKNQVVWLARIGLVAAAADGTHVVQYQGDLVKVDGRRLIFRDGTVLTLANGLHPPADAEGATYAVIDPRRHVVQGATFAPPKLTTTTTRR